MECSPLARVRRNQGGNYKVISSTVSSPLLLLHCKYTSMLPDLEAEMSPNYNTQDKELELAIVNSKRLLY